MRNAECQATMAGSGRTGPRGAQRESARGGGRGGAGKEEEEQKREEPCCYCRASPRTGARAARPRERSVRDPRAGPRRPGPGDSEVGAGGGRALRGWGAHVAPKAPAGPGGAPQPGVPQGLGAAQGAVVVASPVARMSLPPAAGPPTRFSAREEARLKGTAPRSSQRGRRVLPSVRDPCPGGRRGAHRPRPPAPDGAQSERGALPRDGRRGPPGGQVFLRPERGRWRRAGPEGAGL